MRKISHWLEEFSPPESLDILRELAIRHAREGGAVGRQIIELIKRGDFKALVEFELDYSDPAWSAHAVKQCRQALAFFQKLKYLEIGIDRESGALQKFLEAEELCRQTNEVLSACRVGRLQWPNRVNSVFHAATRKIARVLGEIPSLSELDLRFGPGATRGVKRKDASIRSKLAESIQCSEDLLPAAAMLLGEMPHLTSLHQSPGERIVLSDVVEDVNSGTWSARKSDEFDHVLSDRIGCETFADYSAEIRAAREGRSGLLVDEMALVPVSIVPARLNFVPKSAKAYRSVCTEAGLNVMFQLAVGKVMATRLAAVGVDIRDQTPNQRRAREGSLTGALATLDLSSASDTISREIVFELLPLPWAELLSLGRSTEVEMPNGARLLQEKFSSMGNGYTFPLETLIFWSLAASCCDRDSDVSVYGDDIVVPTDRANLVREVLHYAGFVVNVGKSFQSGPFRESCGKDYYKGMDVRPFYQKEWISGQSLFVLHNFYVRDLNFEMAYFVESLIHSDLKLWGPDGYGDGHLIGEHPKERPEKHHIRGYGGYFFDTFTTKQRRDLTAASPGDYVLPHYSVYRRGDKAESFDEVLDSKILTDASFRGSLLDSTRTDYLVRDAIDRAVARAPLPLPWSKAEGVKALTLPGVDGYKRITIYTLGS